MVYDGSILWRSNLKIRAIRVKFGTFLCTYNSIAKQLPRLPVNDFDDTVRK
jgi:hypothetical protein